MLTPTPEIQKVLKLIEELLSRLQSESSKIQFSGQYQSDITIANFLKLLTRNVESILCLAWHDLFLLPSALVLSRSVLETAANTLWLMQPEDVFDREMRLVALLSDEEKQRETYINNLITLKVENSEIEEAKSQKQDIQEYRDSIVSRIPNNYAEIKKPQRIESLLDSLNLKNIYPTYRILCSPTHANHSSTWMYKRSLDQGDEFGERIEPRDWHTPLFICCWALAKLGSKFLNKFEGGIEEFLSESMQQKVQQALDGILSS
ncbi:MAG TPA: DUF5677 domain-containing protein [Allocoleopsis sp.]